MECKNCKTELTLIENEKGDCMRCLACHPITAYVPPKDKKDSYVDVPWTKERIVAICKEVFADEIEDWYIGANTDEDNNKIHPRQPDNPPKQDEPPKGDSGLEWRMQAKQLGIKLCKETGGARKKVDVLADIAEKTKSPDKGQ